MATRRTQQIARHIHENFYDGASDDGSTLQLWAYTSRLSYRAGDTLELHVNTSAPSYHLQIHRDDLSQRCLYQQAGLPGHHYPTPDGCSKTGCVWPVAWRFEIPVDWKSAAYLITLTAETGDAQVQYHHIVMVTRGGTQPAAPMALLCATSTWVAYNDWGGANSYQGFEGPDGDQFSPILSTQRPWARGFCKLPPGAPRTIPEHPFAPGTMARYPHKEWAYAHGFSVKYASAGWASYERHFAHWAQTQGYDVDVLTLHDIHANPDLLSAYRCVVVVGHDEYWSWQMRDAVDNYVEDGGHVARFAGNFLWQIRLQDECRTQICYKYIARHADPLTGTSEQRHLTGAWEMPEINRPGATTFGVNGSNGVYAGVGHCVPGGTGGFTIYRPQHWAFHGTYLSYGDVLGATSRIFGYEVDGLDYIIRDGLPFPARPQSVPDGLSVLGLGIATNTEADHGVWGQDLFIGDADCAFLAAALYGEDNPENRDKVTRGNGMIVSFSKGKGEVFSGASCEWVMGLTRNDMQVQTVTRNVLNRFCGV